MKLWWDWVLHGNGQGRLSNYCRSCKKILLKVLGQLRVFYKHGMYQRCWLWYFTSANSMWPPTTSPLVQQWPKQYYCSNHCWHGIYKWRDLFAVGQAFWKILCKDTTWRIASIVDRWTWIAPYLWVLAVLSRSQNHSTWNAFSYDLSPSTTWCRCVLATQTLAL